MVPRAGREVLHPLRDGRHAAVPRQRDRWARFAPWRLDLLHFPAHHIATITVGAVWQAELIDPATGDSVLVAVDRTPRGAEDALYLLALERFPHPRGTRL